MLSYFRSERATLAADVFAIGIAVTLPWSTSGTLIFAALWLLATLPTLSIAEIRRMLASPAAVLPLALVVLSVIGMTWAAIPSSEKWLGFRGFSKLLAIPILLIQFQRSDRGWWVLRGYFYACVAVLALSLLLVLRVPLPLSTLDYGVPVKSASNQSFEFVLCAMALIYLAHRAYRAMQWPLFAGLTALCLLFFWNILFVASSRTALLCIPVLLLIFAYKKISMRGKIITAALGILFCVIAWFSSNYVQSRLMNVLHETQAYSDSRELTSSGERLEFWKKSIVMIKAAPLVGHGTGSVTDQFRKAIANETGVYATASTNPHQQILAVAIQLGVVGVLVLLAMWFAHLYLFSGDGFAAWIGLCVVVQNLIGSLFNSHLLDFNQGWIYTVGVGVASALTLREAKLSASART